MKLETFHIGTFKSTELKAAPAHLFELLFLFLSYHGKARGLHVSLPCSGPCPSRWRKTRHFSLQFWAKTVLELEHDVRCATGVIVFRYSGLPEEPVCVYVCVRVSAY